MKELAEASGGQDYYPKDVAEVEQITPQVAHEIRNQYLLAYSPTNPALDGTFRQIKVKVTGLRKRDSANAQRILCVPGIVHGSPERSSSK